MVPADIMLLLMLIPSMLTALSVVRKRNSVRSPILRGACHQGRISAGQATALCGRGADPVCDAGRAGDPALPGTAQGQLGNPGPRGGNLRPGQHGVRSAHFGLRHNSNRRHLCRRHHHYPSRGSVFRDVCPRVVADRRGMVRRQDLPSTYFLAISVSTFTKALGLAALWRNIAALGVIAILYFVTSVALLDSGRLRR